MADLKSNIIHNRIYKKMHGVQRQHKEQEALTEKRTPHWSPAVWAAIGFLERKENASHQRPPQHGQAFVSRECPWFHMQQTTISSAY
jgi:hypothetical protein